MINCRVLISFVFLLFGTSATFSQTNEYESDELLNAFFELGFERVQYDDCVLSFGRKIAPTNENNGFHFLQWTLDLKTLGGLSSSEIHSYVSNGEKFYLLDLVFDDTYFLELVDFRSFRSWVFREFSGSKWPYNHPSEHDVFARAIEVELANRVLNLEELNQRVTFSNSGTITSVIEQVIIIPAPEFEQLERLKVSLSNYANINSCDVEN